MFTTDFTKMFDPTQYTQNMQQNMQKFFDWSGAMSASKQNLEVMKQVGTIMTDTIATCTEKQFKYAQSTMEDCVETMRELSTAKGVEEYMSKQAEISKRSTEKAQSIAQDIANTWQKSQARCTDLISQQLSQSMSTMTAPFSGSAMGSGTATSGNRTGSSSK